MKTPPSRKPRRATPCNSIEPLESRVAPASLTWTGGGGNVLWSEPGNWTDGGGLPATPADGDTLIFDDTGTATVPLTNNTTAGNSYSLIFNNTTHNYAINGNRITLDNAGDDILQNGTGTTTLNVALTPETATTIGVAGGAFTLGGVVSSTGGGTFNVTGGTFTTSALMTFTDAVMFNINGGSAMIGGGLRTIGAAAVLMLNNAGAVFTTSSALDLSGTSTFNTNGGGSTTIGGTLTAGAASAVTVNTNAAVFATTAALSLSGMADFYTSGGSTTIGDTLTAGTVSTVAFYTNGGGTVSTSAALSLDGASAFYTDGAGSHADIGGTLTAGAGSMLICDTANGGSFTTSAALNLNGVTTFSTDGSGSTTTVGGPLTAGATSAVNIDTTNGGALAVNAGLVLNGTTTFNTDGAGSTAILGGNVTTAAGSVLASNATNGGSFTTISAITLSGMSFFSTNTGGTTVIGDLTATGGSAVVTVNVSGGGFTAGGALTFSNSSSFNITGGTFGVNGALAIGGSAVFNVSGGTAFLNGPISGTADVIKNGVGTLTLSAAGTYGGGTHVNDGTLVLASALAAGAGLIDIGPTASLTVSNGGIVPNPILLTGGSGPNGLGALHSASAGVLTAFSGKITLAAGNSGIGTELGGDMSFNGVLEGPGTFTKLGAGTLILKNANNTFGAPGDVTINAGVLEVKSNGALGNLGNVIVINSATLRTTGSFTTTRDISANGTAPTVEVASGTLTFNGVLGGTSPLQKAGAGTLLFGPNVTGNVLVNTGTLNVGGTKLIVTGTGDIVVHIVSNGMGGTLIDEVELVQTDAGTVLVINGPAFPATTTINKITSTDPTNVIGTIKLGKTVILGDGMDDGLADVDIRGKVNKLLLSDINPFCIFELGKGLPYDFVGDATTPDSYNNRPDIKLRTVLGAGVTIDVTGDGVTEAGVGGGGLGKVVVQSWADVGLVKTTQSITNFQIKTGDCNVVFEVDKLGLGLFTIAGMGSMSVPNGAWGSTGSVIEGMITNFTAAQFLQNANITTGGVGTFKIKTGDFLGYVNSTDDMRNISIKGAMKGSIQAKSIGKITAEYYDGTTTGDGYGDALRHNIVTTLGGIGTLTAKPHDLDAYGIRNYEIVNATSFGGLKITDLTAPGGFVGVNNVTVQAGSIGALSVTVTGAASIKSIQNSTFESNATIAKITTSHTVTGSMFAAATDIGKIAIGGDLTLSHILAGTFLGDDALLGGMSTAADVFTKSGKIAGVTVTGAFSATTIAAGIDPGNATYGDGDDILSPNGVAPSGTTKAIGILIFGAGSGTAASSSGLHNYAIIANTIKSLTVNGSPVTGFPKFLDLGAPGEDPGDVLVKTI